MRSLATLALPSHFAFLLFALGVLAAFWRRSRRWTPGLLVASGAVLLLFSTGMMAAALMSPLEYAYPAVHDARGHPQVRNIVVLTGYAADDHDMPLSARMNSSGAFRVLMAARLFRDCVECRVIVSGKETAARIMQENLVELGVPRDRLVADAASPHTEDSLRAVGKLVGREPFFLVTSSGHLPRCMLLVARHGLDAVPVPTDYQLPRDWRRAELAPSVSSLAASDLAVREYLGLLWYRLRG